MWNWFFFVFLFFSLGSCYVCANSRLCSFLGVFEFCYFSSLLFSAFFFDSFLYLLDSILCICICTISLSFSWTLCCYKLYACRFLVCSLFCCFILAFIPSLGAELILILLLHPRSLLSFHFLFLFDPFHYQTLSLHF